MKRKIGLFIFKHTGWTVDENLPPNIKKCIIIAVPHTSNWDFWYMIIAFSIYQLKIRFTIKKEWLRFPFTTLLNYLGAIAIDRSPRLNGSRPSNVEAMTELFNNHEELRLVITPEGTRSNNNNWKTGFFHVAQNAQVPILLGYIDYKTKKAGIGKQITPTNFNDTMQEIVDFYKNITPKYPKKFSLHNLHNS